MPNKVVPENPFGNGPFEAEAVYSTFDAETLSKGFR